MRVMDGAIKRFIEHYKDDVPESALQYEAGKVVADKYGFHIGWEQYGAQETFSVGQPVYDEYGNIMGYLGIGLFSSLDYSTDRKIRIPVSFWQICLPTQHCKAGKKVFTYWQNKKMAESEEE